MNSVVSYPIYSHIFLSIDSVFSELSHRAGLYLLLLVIIFLLIKLYLKMSAKEAGNKAAATPLPYDMRAERLLDDAKLVMYKTNLKGDFIFLTNLVHQLTGYSKEELVGKNYSMLIDEDDFPELSTHYIKQAESGIKETVLEFCILTKSGKRKWVEQIAVLQYDEQGAVCGYQCIVRDIDSRKKLQAGLREVEKDRRSVQLLLQAILDNSPSMIFAKDPLGNYLLVNKRFEEIFNLKGTSVIGRNDYFFTPTELADNYREADQWVMEHRQVKKEIVQIMSHEGHKDFMVIKFPLFNDSNSITCICGFAYDITDQVSKQKELEIAREIAENAEKAQEHFLANVSHEMRTPLNGIMGMNSLLASTELNEEQTEYVNTVRDTSESLLVLINDLLDLSKIKAGKLTTETIDFDPRQLCATTFPALQHQARKKQVDFRIEIDPSVPPTLKGDAYRLRQILINLLGNSVKFTQHGFVGLKVTLAEKIAGTAWITFEVADSGMGISKDKMASLFKEFTQLGTDISRKFGGTGLGLAITKQLVHLQNGMINVESEPEKGTKFIVNIPYGFADTPLKEVDGDRFNLQNVPDVFKGATILVVEDNLINQKVVSHPLQKAGASIVIASNGREAADALEDGLRPDLILMDLGMPVMDGYETTTYIRTKLQLTVPIIALTASGLSREKEKCLQFGMNGYLSKPLAMKSLFETIYSFLNHQEPREKGVKEESPEAVPIEGKHYDLAFLNEMEDAEYSKDILSSFLQDTPAALAQLLEKVQQSDWPKVFQMAHKLKSSLGLLKMEKMLSFMIPVESKAREQNSLEAIPELVNLAISEYKLVSPMLEDELEKLQTDVDVN